MHPKKDYIIVKDRHPRISEVLNDCVKLCVPASNGEPLSSILQKICGKITGVITQVSALEVEVDALQVAVGGCPLISEDVGNIIECRDDGIFAEAPEGGGGDPLRFGVAGEDDTAGENREFLLDQFKFTVPDGSVTFANAAENGLTAYFTQYAGGDSEIYLSPLDVNNGSIFAPFIDIYSGSDGTDGYIDIFIAGNSTEDAIDIFMTPGSMTFAFDVNTEWLLDGIKQDDTSVKILAMDASDNVKWIDKDSIGGVPSPIEARLTTEFISPDGMGGGGAAIQNITGLTIALAASTRYEIDTLLFVEINGSGPVEQFQIAFDVTPVQGGLTYEIMGVETGGDPLSFVKTVGFLANDIATSANFTSTYIPAGFVAVRVKGIIVTDAGVTTVQVKAGVFASTGTFIINKQSYIKAIEI